MKKIVLSLLVITSLASCATQRAQLGATYELDGAYKVAGRSNFYIGGIGQTQRINAKKACGDKNPIAVEATQSPADLGLALITFGIYTPWDYNIYCK
jgi:Bor protein